MNRNHTHGGFALVYALIIVVVVGILALGSLVSANINRTIAANDRAALSAQQFAEAGVNRFKTLAAVSHRYIAANLGEYDVEIDPCTGGSVVNMGIELNFDNAIDMVPRPEPYVFTMTLPDGTAGGYEIYLLSGGEQLVSRGFVGTAASPRAVSTRAVRYSVPGAGPFNNAIFVADGGFTGPSINGNLAVYGSVHSVKGDIVINDPGLELGGTAGVYDDYYGSGSSGSNIAAAVERLGVVSDVDTLCSRIKLKSGDLDITSNAVNVGDPSNSVIGIYLDQGYDITGFTGNVHVDTASLVSLYNSEVDAAFPDLATNYPNEIGVGFRPLVDFLSDSPCMNFFLVPGKGNDPPSVPTPPKLNLPPRVGEATAFTCTVGGNTITWNPASDSTPGKIDFSNASGEVVLNTFDIDIDVHADVLYSGKAVFRAGSSPSDATADIAVNGSMIPVEAAGPVAAGYTAGGYPEISALAFVSAGTMEVGTAAQLDMAALLYANGTMTVSKQTTILGSAVARTINIGQNVSRIAYMPGIESAFASVPGGTDSLEANIPVRTAEERR